MIYGAILAGGSGTRMHISSMPKQFCRLIKAYHHSHFGKMLTCTRFDAIYLGIHPSWMSHMTDLLEKYDLDLDKIHLAPGGESRNDTIFNIIDEIAKDLELLRTTI